MKDIKVANAKPESELVDNFKTILKQMNVVEEVHLNCKSKTSADIEFNDFLGDYFVIEAKVSTTKDKHNNIHKIFGELLKETGRPRTNIPNIRYAILIDNDEFFSNGFNKICKEKYLGFGKLIPIKDIFILKEEKLLHCKWNEFLCGNKLQKIVSKEKWKDLIV
ncbi:MAG: hypothetical protein EKK57_08710 [Proteobacteria bacterium]|nr:MAG: hypothetical protein EKK57_08710 [Pseudomonadota bacterium]